MAEEIYQLIYNALDSVISKTFDSPNSVNLTKTRRGVQKGLWNLLFFMEDYSEAEDISKVSLVDYLRKYDTQDASILSHGTDESVQSLNLIKQYLITNISTDKSVKVKEIQELIPF